MSSCEPTEIFLSIGSNLSDRESNLRQAVRALQQVLRVKAVSWIYETDPVGVTAQPAFLNIAVAAETRLTPVELLRTIKQIEGDVGRRPTFRWGPRVIDIDILLYGDVQVETVDLTIPHRELTNRAFVLIPLAEIAPGAIYPLTNESVEELRDQLGGEAGVRRLRPLTISPIS